jgi:hypothetical protein
MSKLVQAASESVVSRYENRMQQLIIEAEAEGVVLTVSTEPVKPLAMGNYKMVASARSAVVYEDD